MNNPFGGGSLGPVTQTAGTVISACIPANALGITRVSKVVYTCAGTAHTITSMRALGSTTTSAAAAAAATVINLTADPGAAISNSIAANDFIVVKYTNGSYGVIKVTSVSTLAITVPALSYAIASGSPVWFFGVVGDVDPLSGGLAHMTTVVTASTVNTFSDTEGGFVTSWAKYQPIIIQSNNAAAAGKFEQISYSYTTT